MFLLWSRGIHHREHPSCAFACMFKTVVFWPTVSEFHKPNWYHLFDSDFIPFLCHKKSEGTFKSSCVVTLFIRRGQLQLLVVFRGKILSKLSLWHFCSHVSSFDTFVSENITAVKTNLNKLFLLFHVVYLFRLKICDLVRVVFLTHIFAL